MDVNALKQKRAGLAKQARAIMDGAEALSRSMTSEEETEFDRMMDDVDKLDRTIAREEKLREQEKRVAGDNPPEDDPNGPGTGTEQERKARAWRVFLRDGRAGLTQEHARALNMGSDPEGGYLVAPTQWVTELLQAVDDEVPLRGIANVVQLTSGESLGVPTLDTDLGDAEWTSEVATGSQDDALRFGGRELSPNPLAKRVKISRTLLRRASRNPEQIVRDRMSYKFGVTQEKAFMVGDGNKKPLGLFTASAQGISTNRDIAIGSGGAIPLTPATGDQLIDAKYTLKGQYWSKARWLFHRDLIRTIRKIKTTDGFYVWQAGLASDRPDTILDVPFIVSEWVPNTITGNNYVGMIGDFSFYWIVDALSMEVQRLVELYAESNQVGFIGRLETDAMPVLEEPFVRLKVAA
ncbi:phage major capsid protein [Sphaerisporangium sp. NPDC049003]|uniref:phage major capsid protein n=1 Tax=Sphaerisporangium sp. NPDC049003 TaxID=3364517 RepID=UPI0037146C6D